MTGKRTQELEGAIGLWGVEATQLELEDYVRSRLPAAETEFGHAAEPDWVAAEFDASWAQVVAETAP